MSYEYFENLSKEASERYKKKLQLIGIGDCPYKIPADDWKDDPTGWPTFSYHQLYHFLIKTPRIYSPEAMENFKSLQAYKFFIDGWVQTVKHITLSTGAILMSANVRPSYRTTDTPHKPWVTISCNGNVIAAHCNCMAGLGETCSHVAAVLYKVEAAVRIGLTKNAPTDLPCAWNQNFTKNVHGSPVAEINLYGDEAKQNLTLPRKTYDNEATYEQKMNFLSELSQLKTKPVALHLFEGFDKTFIQTKNVSIPQLPPSLREIYIAKRSVTPEEMGEQLQTMRRLLENISVDKLSYTEETTRGQSDCLTWFEQRAGRITGSTLKSVYNAAEKDVLSESLVKKICSCVKLNINSPPLLWGREMEKCAYSQYQNICKGEFHGQQKLLSEVIIHEGFEINDIGFCIDTEKGWFGASPDAVVFCKCCGYGVAEFKCPYSLKEKSLSEEIMKGNFYVEKRNGEFCLKENHSYYFQVQLEMKVTQVAYCDFMVWTPAESLIIRIGLNSTFLEKIMEKATEYWSKYIFQELFTRQLENKEVNKIVSAPITSSSYCICKKPYSTDEEMVGCDKCNEWFHPQCLGMKGLPKSKTWYCKKCKKEKNDI